MLPNKPPDGAGAGAPKSPPVAGAGDGVLPKRPPVAGAGAGAPKPPKLGAGAGVEPPKSDPPAGAERQGDGNS